MEETINISLKWAMIANGLFSMGSGLLLVILAPLFYPHFGLKNGILPRVIGSGLILFAINLLFMAKNPKKQRNTGIAAVIGDLAWAIGTVIILILSFPGIDNVGRMLLIIVGLVVLIFALWQGGSMVDPSGTLAGERVIEAPPDLVWEVVADVDGYAHYVPRLSDSRIISGEGVGMVRKCWDTRGNSWSEQCIVWEEGRIYTFDVNTEDLTVPLNKFQGTFGVEPEGDKSKMFVRFDLLPKYGLFGKFLILLGQRKHFNSIENIFDNWEKQILGYSNASDQIQATPKKAERGTMQKQG